MEQSNEKIKMLVYHLEEDEKIPTEKWDIIPGKLYEIGRSKKETDLPLDIKLLSRKHAELIYYNNKKILIKDLNSRNGTYLNKIRLEPLQDVYFTTNDILSFGNASNKIVFLSSREEKKRKDSELDRTEKIKKKSYDDENYEKREKIVIQKIMIININIIIKMKLILIEILPQFIVQINLFQI